MLLLPDELSPQYLLMNPKLVCLSSRMDSLRSEGELYLL